MYERETERESLNINNVRNRLLKSIKKHQRASDEDFGLFVIGLNILHIGYGIAVYCQQILD